MPVTRCAAPFLFEGDYDEGRYAVGASGLFMEILGNRWFVTAGHAVRAGSEGDVRLLSELPGLGRREQLECNALAPQDYLIRPTGGEDCHDIVAFRIDPNSPPSATIQPASVEQVRPASQLGVGDQLAARGYPIAVPGTAVNYDERRIRLQAAWMPGHYEGAAAGRFRHTLSFENLNLVDLNRLSGAPVFSQFEGIWRLSGLMLQAGAAGARGHFIDIEIVVAYLTKAEKAILAGEQ